MRERDDPVGEPVDVEDDTSDVPMPIDYEFKHEYEADSRGDLICPDCDGLGRRFGNPCRECAGVGYLDA